MVIAPKGEKIICQKGHICGELDVDVEKNDIIRPNMFQLNLFDDVDITTNKDGHICKLCGEQVTEMRNETYRVHTIYGWIGRRS